MILLFHNNQKELLRFLVGNNGEISDCTVFSFTAQLLMGNLHSRRTTFTQERPLLFEKEETDNPVGDHSRGVCRAPCTVCPGLPPDKPVLLLNNSDLE